MQNAKCKMQKFGREEPTLNVALYVADEREGWRVNEDTPGQNLRERTTQYARRIIRLYVALPKTTLAKVLGKQLLRSGTSVGANYRECCRGRSKAEFIAKMGDCLKELDETAYWLELLVCEELLSAQTLAPLRDETKQLVAIFVSSMNRAKSAD